MLTSVVLLMLSGLVASGMETCPENFACQWEGNVFALRCKLANDKQQSEVVVELHINVKRLKIDCNRQRGFVQLTFANLSGIRELTLANIHFTSKAHRLFYGVENISHLVLHNVYWKRVGKNCFDGLSQLQSLTLDHLNQLEYMHPDVLTPLVSLQSLSFRHIGLPYNAYPKVLKGIASSNVQSLTLHGIRSAGERVDLALLRNRLSESPLKRLELADNNYIVYDRYREFMYQQLQHMSITGNVFARDYFELVVWFMEMFNGPMKTFQINTITSPATEVSTKSLRSLTLHSGQFYPNNIKQYYFEISPTLETLSFSQAVILWDGVFLRPSDPALAPDIQYAFTFVFHGGNNLKHIDVSNFKSTQYITFSFGELPALKYFNLQNIHSVFIDEFSGMPNLTVLLLGKNDIGDIVAKDTENHMFTNNSKLRVLDLAKCGLSEIPRQSFSNLQELQHLNLSGNRLKEFHVELQTLKELRFLNLNRNKLDTLTLATRSQLDEVATEGNIHVDISGNPLHCYCYNINFVMWIHTTRVKFVNTEDTFCTADDNTLIRLFNTDSEALVNKCKRKHFDTYHGKLFLPTILPTMIVIVVASVVLCVLYKYRWKWAHVWNRFTKYQRCSAVQLDQVTYERDAFICYNSNDSHWVCHDLLDRLDSNGISTVIYDRDFLSGSVLEQICQSIDKSRFTVLVLSPDFLSSNRCLLAMHLARIRIISQGRDVIVPIILRKFPTSQVTRTLEGILSKLYLQWTEDPEGQALFWDKLITKLKHGGNLRPLDN